MSNRNKIFTQVPIQRPSRNNFDLSHEVKMSGKFGYLYPFFTKECIPGDTWRHSSTILSRFAPMLAPIMHRVDITTHFFFVPYRLLWDSWEKFITGGKDGTFTAVPPYWTYPGMEEAGTNLYVKGSLFDYFGLPVFGNGETGTSTEQLSALPFYAYTKIWNDYYMDPNLADEVEIPTQLDGNVNVQMKADFIQLRRRGWERDYFTSNLPWAQRGAEVLLPISGIAEAADIDYKEFSTIHYSDGSLATGSPLSALAGAINTPTNSTRIENIDQIEITNTVTTYNEFRRGLALQQWLEINARSGHRYNEQIQGHFDVRVPDFRLQRAEYLGGGKQPVVISEVLATSNSTNPEENDSPLGDMGGHGLSVGRSNKFSYYTQEHGVIIGILSILPRSGYASQGIERMWTRKDKFDWPWPKLANIGEQETLKKELFFINNAADDDYNNEAFGYLPRYAEWKYAIDRVSGDFRDDLAHWHLNRILVTPPSLDELFVTMYENDASEVDSRRIFAVQDGTDYIWMQIHHSTNVQRALPYFGVPSGL